MFFYYTHTHTHTVYKCSQKGGRRTKSVSGKISERRSEA